MADDWYRTFFEGIVVDVWRAATPAEATVAEADFLERELALEPGARVLDAPCGHGRHSVELAARGYRVVGVDLSAEMLAVARREAAERGVTVDWRQADMRELPRDGSFDAAFCFGNSFGYLGPAGNREYLQAVAASLRTGGRFVMHTGMVAEAVLPRLEERSWSPLGDLMFLEENHYDATESCLETVYTFVRGGESVTRSARHWVYTVRELRELLASCGLTTTALYSSTDGKPYELDSPLLLVAERG
jgi:cyclopropane fatty-acyl-phospholipid synthase-like methyltransferase